MCKAEIMVKVGLDLLSSIAYIPTCNGKKWSAGVIGNTFGGRSLSNL